MSSVSTTKTVNEPKEIEIIKKFQLWLNTSQNVLNYLLFDLNL